LLAHLCVCLSRVRKSLEPTSVLRSPLKIHSSQPLLALELAQRNVEEARKTLR
jgi:hypothetical protein